MILLFELPSGQGQLPLKDMKEIYPDFTKIMLKKGVDKFYTLNPLTKISKNLLVKKMI